MVQSPSRQTENLPTTRSVLDVPQLKDSEQIVGLPIADIHIDGGTHARDGLNEQHIQDLKQELDQGHDLDPMDVFWDGSNYWLSDGFHRIEAYEQASRKHGRVRILQGTQRDAALHGIRVNAKHKALKWSRQDKQRAIERLLRDPEWQQWSDNAIAQLCRVDNKTVTQRRLDLGIPKSNFRRGSDGRIINTERIGESNPANKLPTMLGESNLSSDLKEESRADRPLGIAPELKINRDQPLEVELKQWQLTDSTRANLEIAREIPTQNGLHSPQHQSRMATTRPNNRRQRTKQEKEPLIIKPKTVKPGEWWKLGKNNFLYCGEAASKHFQKHLPEKVELLIRVVSTSDQWTQPLPNETVSGLALFSPYEGERDLSIFRGMIEQAVDLYTDPGDPVVLAYLPDPSILILMDELNTVCFCAEPDPERCGSAIARWTVTKQPSEKLKQPPNIN